MSAKLDRDSLNIDIFKYSLKPHKFFVYYFTSKVWLDASNHIVDMVMCPNFRKLSISLKEVMVTSILQMCDQKQNDFFRGGFGSSSMF